LCSLFKYFKFSLPRKFPKAARRASVSQRAPALRRSRVDRANL
jgi:hypothetical protein